MAAAVPPSQPLGPAAAARSSPRNKHIVGRGDERYGGARKGAGAGPGSSDDVLLRVLCDYESNSVALIFVCNKYPRAKHGDAQLEDLTAAMAPPRRAAGQTAAETAGESVLSAPIEALTRKEREVLRLLAEGLPNAVIAARLGVSDSTVRTHLRAINSKLDARNRTQAVAVARRMGVLA